MPHPASGDAWPRTYGCTLPCKGNMLESDSQSKKSSCSFKLQVASTWSHSDAASCERRLKSAICPQAIYVHRSLEDTSCFSLNKPGQHLVQQHECNVVYRQPCHVAVCTSCLKPRLPSSKRAPALTAPRMPPPSTTSPSLHASRLSLGRLFSAALCLSSCSAGWLPCRHNKHHANESSWTRNC